MRNDTQKIIILTGAFCSGKTTVKKHIISLLSGNNISYKEIYAKDDLYLPFARQQGLLESAIVPQTREEMTLLMRKIYDKYGYDIGSKLLVEFLATKSKNTIYILDSKRNPEGIKFLLKKYNCVVVGIYTSLKERLKRIEKRSRSFDSMTAKKRVTIEIEREESIFQVSKSLLLADIVIDNSVVDDNSYLIKLTKVLVEKDVLPSISVPNRFPLLPSFNSKKYKDNDLRRAQIPEILNKFAVR